MSESKNASMNISSNSGVKDESIQPQSHKQEETLGLTAAEFLEAFESLDNDPELVRQITLALIAKPGDHRKIGEC